MNNFNNFNNDDEEIYELINKNQINLSKGNLEYFIRKGNNEIENIKMQNERKENEKKIKEEIDRNERFKKIREETQESIRKNAELEMKWSEIKEIEECEELQLSLKDYIDSFNEILKSKLRLIEEIKEDIKRKDEEYVQDTKNMYNEINDIVSKSQSQVWNLRQSCIQEYKKVEQDLTDQITKMISNNNNTIMRKLEVQRLQEKKLQIERISKEDSYFRDLEKTKIDKQKEYSSQKVKIETNIQNCEKCLEEMKALYLLISEKLSYNSKILLDKELEHETLTKDLSKKERHFENVYKNKINDLNKINEKYKDQNKYLTKQYESTSRQYKELHNKFEHFEKSEIEKYIEIKEMNEKEIILFKEKIKKCDQIIHNQQLGIIWKENINETEINNNDNSIIGNEEFENNSEQEINSINSNNNKMQSKNKTISADAIEEIPGVEKLCIINLLINEIDFIFDDKIKNDLSYETEKNQLMGKINVLRKVLSIHSIDDIHKLIWDIYNNCKEITTDEEEDKLLENDENEEYYYQVYNSDKIVQILQDFKVNKQNVVIDSEDKEKRKELKRELKEKKIIEEKNYWDNFTKVLSDEKINVWKILEKFSLKYYSQLLERQKLIDETSSLHQQNEELKKLLNQYLKIEHGLVIPPNTYINEKLDENKFNRF